MALTITSKCVNCGICETECPNHAIYPPAEQWNFATGNMKEENMSLVDGTVVDAREMQSPRSLEYYYIVQEKCTECEGFHEKPRCASVCPENCCIRLQE